MLPAKTKSRSFRRKNIRPPGGKLVIHYSRRAPAKLKCSNCKKELHGIPRKISSKFKNLPKSKKTVSRPYGGNLCSICSRIKLKELRQ